MDTRINKEKQYNNNIGIKKVFELCDLLDLVSKLETSEKCTRTFLSEISVQFLGWKLNYGSIRIHIPAKVPCPMSMRAQIRIHNRRYAFGPLFNKNKHFAPIVINNCSWVELIFIKDDFATTYVAVNGLGLS